MSKCVGSVLSEKFSVELENFFLWCVEVEYLVYKGEEEKKWNVKLNGKFEEPSRGKMEKFLEGVFEKFSIWKGDFEVNDFKLLVKEWKLYMKTERERKSGIKKLKEEFLKSYWKKFYREYKENRYLRSATHKELRAMQERYVKENL
jgi:hypothetical protein